MSGVVGYIMKIEDEITTLEAEVAELKVRVRNYHEGFTKKSNQLTKAVSGLEDAIDLLEVYDARDCKAFREIEQTLKDIKGGSDEMV